MIEEDGVATPLTQRIESVLAPSLQAMGYAVVRVALHGGARRQTLQVMAERVDGRAMTVEDCADVSRAVSAILDVEDPIDTAYTLEVSSPGIDRPLTRRADYIRFAGFEARVETVAPVDGRKRFRGRLLGLGEDDLVAIRDEAAEYRVPFTAIQRAKLILTDELIARSPDRPPMPSDPSTATSDRPS
jgi:ribosome maturation factor RimP